MRPLTHLRTSCYCIIGIILGLFILPPANSMQRPLILNEKIKALKKAANPGGSLGVSVYSLKHNRFEMVLGDTMLYTPASCLKVLVTATALNTFPSNYFPKTHLTLNGIIKGSAFHGNLTVIGGGDPNISGRYFKDYFTVLGYWADSISSLGIDTIIGRLLTIDSLFQGPHQPPQWKPEYYNKWFGAEISSLSYNDNCYDITIKADSAPGLSPLISLGPDIGYVRVINNARTVIGKRNLIRYQLHQDSNIITIEGSIGISAPPTVATVPVRNATGYFARAFTRVLSKKGIHFKNKHLSLNKNQKPYKTFIMRTVPVINILEEVNQRSQNFMAETLLRLLGGVNNNVSSVNSGIHKEKIFLHKLGLDSSNFILVDGSGLSDSNRIRVSTLTRFLSKMARHPLSGEFINTLATPGIHGVRAQRLKHLQHTAKIKTGFINGVQGVCGYIYSADGDTLAVGVFLNNYHIPHKKASNLVDSIFSGISAWYNMESASIEKAAHFYADTSQPSVFLDRMLYFSKQLEGTPYNLGPTGEGRYSHFEAKPIFNLDSMDCVTYIESVMALSLSPGPEGIMPVIKDIRYINGIVSYENRKHFFIEDWLLGNPHYVKLFRFPNDTTHIKYTGKIRFFNSKGLSAPHNDPVTPLSYVPYDQALDIASNWTYGRRLLGVGFITDISWLWVTHTGFLEATSKGAPKLRHASSKSHKVVTEDFYQYLKSRKGKCQGVMFFEFMTPQSSNNP